MRPSCVLRWALLCGSVARSLWVPQPCVARHRRGAPVWSSKTVGDYDGADPWAELGLEPGASKSEIRRAYRQAALRTHPDVNSSPEAAEQFRRVSAAYELVKDKEKFSKWERQQRRRRPSSSSSSRGRATTGGRSWAPPEPEYDDAGGDSFGAIFGDILRGISTPKATARSVVDDLLEILEQIPVDPGARSFATETERRRAEDEQRRLLERLGLMLSNEIEPQLASAKANEAAVKARGDVEELLVAVERTAGLRAKKTACERQIKVARKELEAISTARVGDVAAPPPSPQSPYRSGRASASASSPYRSGPRPSSQPSPRPPPPYASPPPRTTPFEDRATLRDRRVDEELDELKRNLGRADGPSSKRG